MQVDQRRGRLNMYRARVAHAAYNAYQSDAWIIDHIIDHVRYVVYMIYARNKSHDCACMQINDRERARLYTI